MLVSLIQIGVILLMINNFGQCKKQCTNLSTGNGRIYTQANGEASMYVTVKQPCDSGLETLTVVSERDPPPNVPVCQLLVARDGSCEPDNLCSCQPQQGRFKIAGKVSNQEEVWIISGTVRGNLPSNEIKSRVYVFVNATTVQSTYAAHESTTVFDMTSSLERVVEVTANNILTNWLTIVASLCGTLFLSGIVIMSLLYRRVMRKIRREAELNALKMKQEYASSPEFSSQTASKEHPLYELSKDHEYPSEGNVYQDMPPAYSYALDRSTDSDMTLDQSSDADLTSSLSGTTSSATDKQLAVSTDSEQYWQNRDQSDTSSGSTHLDENEIRVYALPFVSSSSLTVCSV